MSKKEELEKKKKIEELKDARRKYGITQASTISNVSKERDTEIEKQTAKRYEKVGVSPIYSRGTFSTNSNIKENNRITEDDKVDELKKKKRK